jgi:hypothetical protein
MAQGEDEALLVGVVDDICEAILAVTRGTDDSGAAVQAAD